MGFDVEFAILSIQLEEQNGGITRLELSKPALNNHSPFQSQHCIEKDIICFHCLSCCLHMLLCYAGSIIFLLKVGNPSEYPSQGCESSLGSAVWKTAHRAGG